MADPAGRRRFGVYGSVPPASVAAALEACPGAACVVLTSPTYEGVLSDVAAIAGICHAHGVPLIVDEAHGAHYLPLAQAHGWRGGALAAGADLVVQSPHKTLPSLTQTALLHLGAGGRIDPDEVERQLDVFETSSPSYPLLVSLDGCTALLAEQGGELFAAWRRRLDRFSAAVRGLGALRVLCHGADAPAAHPAVWAHDAGKLLVRNPRTGAALARTLREDYGFETEMSCGPNVLAMTSVADGEDALDRLVAALLAIDRCLPQETAPAQAAVLPPPGPAVYTIAAALRRPRAERPLADATGAVAAEYVWAYPPGVPLLAPGERITPAFAAAAAALEAAGTPLRHTAARTPGCVAVCAEA